MAGKRSLRVSSIVGLLCAMLFIPVLTPFSGNVLADYDLNAPAGFEVSGVVWHSRLDKLFAVDDGGRIVRMDRDGTNQTIWDVPGDLEGICVPDPQSDRLYVGIEYDGGMASPAIKEFNLTSGSVTGTFYLNLPGATASAGLEALTFVPNASHPQGGQFAVGHQGNGDIYAYDIPIVTGGGSGNTFNGNGTIVTNRTDIAGLHYNAPAKVFFALFDSFDRIQTIRLNGTPMHEYILIAKPGFSEDEGIGEDGNGTLYIGRENQAEGIISAMTNFLDTTAPKVVSVTLSDISPTRAGPVNFTIGFSEPMDTASPAVSFGMSWPFNSHNLTPGIWMNSTHWRGSFTIDEATGDGVQNLSISGGWDLNGNIMEPDYGHTFVIDTEAPRVISVTSSPQSPLGKGQVNFTLNFNEPIDNTTNPAATFGKLDPYTANVITPVGWKNSTIWEGQAVIDSNTGDGLYHLRIGGVADLANNTMAGDWNHTIELDTTGPRVISVSVSDISPVGAGKLDFTIGFDEEMDRAVLPRASFGTTPPYSQHVLSSSGWTDGRNWTGYFEIDGTTGDGLNRLVISNALDAIGNQMVIDNTTELVIDATAPAVQHHSISPASPLRAGTVKFIFDFTEPMNGSIPPLVSFGNISPPAQRTPEQSGWTNSTSWYCIFQVDGTTGEGPNFLGIRGGRDIAGNQMTAFSGNFTVDTCAPVSSVNSGLLPQFSNSTVIPIPVYASDPAPGTGVDSTELWYRPNQTGVAVLATTTTAGLADFTAPGEGVYGLYTIAIDRAGNREAAPATPDAVITVDTRCPSVSSVTFAREGPYTADVGIVISFDEPVNTTTLIVSAGTAFPFDTIATTGDATGPSEWTGTIPVTAAIPGGRYILFIRGASDRAQNLLIPYNLCTFNVSRPNTNGDIVPPVIISVVADRTQPVGDGTMNVTLEFNEDMDLARNLTAGLFLGTAHALAGNWSGPRTWKGSATVDRTWQNGTHVLVITGGSDRAGNRMAEDRTHTMEVKLEVLPPPRPPPVPMEANNMTVLWAGGAIIGLAAIAIVLLLARSRKKEKDG